MFRQFKQPSDCELFWTQSTPKRPLSSRSPNLTNQQHSKKSLKARTPSRSKQIQKGIQNNKLKQKIVNQINSQAGIQSHKNEGSRPLMAINRPGKTSRLPQEVVCSQRTLKIEHVGQSNLVKYAPAQVHHKIHQRVVSSLIYTSKPNQQSYNTHIQPLRSYNSTMYQCIMLKQPQRICSFGHRNMKSDLTTQAKSFRDPCNCSMSMYQSMLNPLRSLPKQSISVQIQTQPISFIQQKQRPQDLRDLQQTMFSNQKRDLQQTMFSNQKMQRQIQEKKETHSIYESQGSQYSQVIVSCRKLIADNIGMTQDDLKIQLFNFDDKRPQRQSAKSSTFDWIVIGPNSQS